MRRELFGVCLGLLATCLPGSLLAGTATANGQYAVATANPYATEAGMKVLADGGTAADAVVAIQMVLGVVEPQSSGLGGGAIALYRSSDDGAVQAYDGLSRSPAAYDPNAAANRIFNHSGASVGAPGDLRLLEMIHQRYGKLPWSNLFESAINLADNGFVVSPYLASTLAASAKAGMPVPAWLLNSAGKPVSAGDTVHNPALAATMKRIAQGGPDALYGGSAPDFVGAIHAAAQPGTLTGDDLAAYRAVERKPLCLAHLQESLCAAPPPSYGGVAVLELLGILDQVGEPEGELTDVAKVHRFIEAGRLAESDRMQIVGDPDVSPEPVGKLLERAFLRSRAHLVHDGSTMPNPLPQVPGSASCSTANHPPLPSTTEIAIVDAAGNTLSMTATNNVDFGAWITVDGFFLNDAMTNFAFLSDGGCPANSPAGNKRPETAMAPMIATDGQGRAILVGGSAGSGEIVDYVSQGLLSLGAGERPQEALDEGHVSSAMSSYPESAGRIELEAGRSVARLAPTLRALGHKDIRIVPLLSGAAFIVREGAHWYGASDPRRDGTFATSDLGAH